MYQKSALGRGMSQEDVEYYILRLRAEREAAVTAASEEARQAHRALAIRYAGMLAACGHPAALEGADTATPFMNPTRSREA
jgi:hypothetical protein